MLEQELSPQVLGQMKQMVSEQSVLKSVKTLPFLNGLDSCLPESGSKV